jgi:sulfite reductase alpha subunit-like flavoprotein
MLTRHSQEDLYEYCFRVKRTIKEVLGEFRSAKVPREYIFDIFPPMRPRQFSIASSIKVSQLFLDVKSAPFTADRFTPKKYISASPLCVTGRS